MSSPRFLSSTELRSALGRTDAAEGARIAHEVAAEQIRLLFRQSPSPLAASALICVVIVTVLWDSVATAPLLGWSGLTLAVTGARWRLVQRFHEADSDVAHLRRWLDWHRVGTACAGLCWGLAGAGLAGGGESREAFLAIVLAGVCAGAVPTLSPVPRVYPVFVLPALLPFVFAMLTRGDAQHFAMGVLALLYLATMLKVSTRLAANIEQSLALRFENDRLVEESVQAAERLARNNEALELEVAERRAAQDVLRRSEQKLRLHALQAPLAFIEWDLNLRAIEWNPAAERIFGFTRDQAIGRRASQLIAAPNICDEVGRLWKRLLDERRPERIVLDNRTADGRAITCEWYYTPLIDSEGRVLSVITLAQDITETRATEQRLKFLAYHDELTGLPNRALFHDRLHHVVTEARRTGRSVGVLLLDLDHFKHVNDTLGHDAGDRVLREAAARIGACLRESDTVARFGGDEFAVLLGDLAEPANAFTIAQKLLDACGAPFAPADHDVFLGASIGITFFPADGDHPDVLVKQADSALHHAKNQGRNNFQFYSTEFTARAQARLVVEAGLRRALERGEFVLHYQPKVDAPTGRVTGMEALIRWQHPERGLLAPGDFIHVAEDSGLIVPIGAWVLHEACRQAQAWRDLGLPVLKLAVNLSPRQFRQPTLVERIRDTLATTGFAAHCLELEITESVLMDHDARVADVFAGLKALGVSISIDDFGTGYSSLSYLRRFPVDTLKIDRSFVREVPVNLDDVAIVRAVISMARSLRLTTVAEGVETEDQMRFLRAEGCDGFQGWLHGRPMPADEFARLVVLRARVATL
jgi:diguanylate cyclase (GGDEF)-like protein/PAS domain S-box-containing protein